MISMKESFIDFFKRYAKFKGKSTRAAYWWMQLIVWIVMLLLIIAATAAGCGGIQWLMWTLGIIAVLFGLTIIIPCLALTFRRYQDVGLSFDGSLIFFVVSIILISFGFLNGFLQTLMVIDYIISFLLLILPTDFLVGKFGKLTRTK